MMANSGSFQEGMKFSGMGLLILSMSFRQQLTLTENYRC